MTENSTAPNTALESSWLRRLRPAEMRGKFGRDINWNLASLIVMSISGLALNVIIGRLYGAEILGAFHQSYSLLLIISQFSILGIHYSASTYTARGDTRVELGGIVIGALVAAGTSSLVVCSLCYALSSHIGSWFDSAAVARGFVVIIPGLFFYTINKTLLFILNGLRLMQAYAIFQILRFVFVFAALTIATAIHLDGSNLPLIISASEGVLFVLLLPFTLANTKSQGLAAWLLWFKRHVEFGLRGMVSGAVTSINARVDVVMLGIFSSDAAVGIYSLAAMVLEGFTQLIVVVRNNLNPIFTRLWSEGETEKLQHLLHRSTRRCYFYFVPLAVLLILGYPLVAIAIGKEQFIQGWGPFAILASGRSLTSGYLALEMLLIQAGFPGTYSILRGVGVVINVGFNALLIPILGMYGAAISNFIGMLSLTVLQKLLVRQKMRLMI